MLLKSVALTMSIFYVSAQSHAEARGYLFPTEGRNVLPPSLGQRLLHPCSRNAPKTKLSFWQPKGSELDELERALEPYLLSLAREGKELPPAGSYDRQYIGIVVGGRKLVYGNFFPPTFREFEPAHRVIDTCDPGPKLWGIVFDPASKKFSKLSFSML